MPKIQDLLLIVKKGITICTRYTRLIVWEHKSCSEMGIKMENNLEAYLEQKFLMEVKKANAYAEQYGLTLTDADCQELVLARKNTLQEQRRVELGGGILPKLIYAFCDSVYLNQDSFREDLERLQDIFYQFKNESMDLLTDDEIIAFMQEQFESICFGDFSYLEGTCLPNFASAVRAGYEGFQKSGGYGEYEQFDEVPRWDRELFQRTLWEELGVL